MARLYVPVANRVVTGHREKYIEQLKRLDNPFVMVYIDRKYDPEVQAKNLAELKENLAYFEAQGFDTGVWVQAFGFGNPLEGREAELTKGYTRITDLNGRVAGDAMCPLNEKYMEFYLTLLRGIAEAGAKRIMLDDTQDAVIELSRRYNEAEFIGCNGQLQGDRVSLDPVGGWRFGAVILRK